MDITEEYNKKCKMFWAKAATAAIVKYGGCRPVYILKNNI